MRPSSHKLKKPSICRPSPHGGFELAHSLPERQQSKAQAISEMSGAHLLADTGYQGANEERHTARSHTYKQGQVDQGCDGQEVQVLER